VVLRVTPHPSVVMESSDKSFVQRRAAASKKKNNLRKKKAYIRTAASTNKANLRKRMKRKDRFNAGRQETLYDGHTYKHTYITYIHIYILTYKHNISWRQAMPGVQ
jgi:hypothetical protein